MPTLEHPREDQREEDEAVDRLADRTWAVVRRIHLGTRQPANWIQLVKFGTVGGSGYAINLAVFALLAGALDAPPPARRRRRLLRRRVEQLLLEPSLDVRRRVRAHRLSGAALLRRQHRRPRRSTWCCSRCWSRPASRSSSSQAIAVALSMPVNFVGNKLWTFGAQALLAALALVTATLAAAPAVPSASAQAPTPGSTAPRTAAPGFCPKLPEGYEISAREAVRIADREPEVAEQSAVARAARRPRSRRTTAAWQVGFSAGDEEVAQVKVDGHTRRRASRRGPAIRSRGRWRAATRASSATCSTRPTSGSRSALVFLLGLIDWRRPWRIVHLDLLVLLAFGDLAHLLQPRRDRGLGAARLSAARSTCSPACLWLGFRGGEGLRPRAPTQLAGDRGGLPDRVPGHDQRRRLRRDRRRLRGDDRRRPDHPRRADLGRGRVPRRQPLRRHLRSGQLLRLRAVRARAAVERRLGRAARLARGGALLRPGGGRRPARVRASGCAVARRARRLGIVLAFAWVAYPYTDFALQSNSNDSLLAALLVWSLALFARPVARGALLGARGAGQVRPAGARAAVSRPASAACSTAGRRAAARRPPACAPCSPSAWRWSASRR